MEKYVLCFIGGLFLYSYFIICWHKLLKKKIDFRNPNIYIVLVLLDVGRTFMNFHLPQFLRLWCTIIMFFVIYYIFLYHNLTKNIITIVYSYLIAFVSEFILVLVLALLGINDMSKIYNLELGVFVTNTLVGLISFIFLKFGFIYKLFNYLLKTFDNMKRSNLIGYFVLTILLISIFLIMSYMKLPVSVLLICNTVLTVLYLVMLFRLANARENYRSINSKYETSLNSLREYESIMDKYRVSNHENKNELLTIRNMISEDDKKTAKYIDKLVDNKIKDNETIFYKASKIPEGGLRAIIYSKLCKMQDEKIVYDLDIANDVKTANLLKIGEGTNLNICKIVGVFLDNAIEAALKVKKPKIIIEIFMMDGYLCIDISNNYKGTIELEKLGTKRYSTKGNGRGYGLSLVKKIIREDDSLVHESRITKDMFTQSLKIKM